MKKLVKLILLCLIAYPIISIVSSCSEEEDCSMNARPMMECYLYTVDRESKRVLNDTLDSLTITAFDTDSVILNNQKRVHSLSLPLRYTADSTVLIFHYSKDPKIKKYVAPDYLFQNVLIYRDSLRMLLHHYRFLSLLHRVFRWGSLRLLKRR